MHRFSLKKKRKSIKKLKIIVNNKNKKIYNLNYINYLLTYLYLNEIHNSYYDCLSGLLNKHGFINYFNTFNNNSYIVILIDIDSFKKINDTLGHIIGDKAIVLVSDLLKEVFCSKDILISRFGGDEFVLASDNLSLNEFLIKLDCLKKMLLKFCKDKIGLIFTLSIGVACCNSYCCFEKAIVCADKALYASKHNGKDTITIYNSF